MAKVYTFVAENGRFNMATAEVFGDIHFCEPEGSIFCTDELQEQIGTALDDFNPQEDYIAATGNHVVVGIALGIAMNMFDFVRILIFDATSSQYIAKRVGEWE